MLNKINNENYKLLGKRKLKNDARYFWGPKTIVPVKRSTPQIINTPDFSKNLSVQLTFLSTMNLKTAVIGRVVLGAGNRVKLDIGYGLSQSGVSGRAFITLICKGLMRRLKREERLRRSALAS